jgi:cellulose synthase (UDP-forming)
VPQLPPIPELLVPLLVFGGLAWVFAFGDRNNRTLRRCLVLVFNGLLIRYHFWRITESLPSFDAQPATLAIYGFYAVELLSGYLTLTDRQLLVGKSNRTAEVESNLEWYGGRENAPLIDVLIPTYNERENILRMTILAARRMEYARHRVWILDDGRREWLRALCAELRVGYVTRSDNAHFKAGNLNSGLRHILSLEERAAFVAVFDADFIAHPQFLQRTVALMKNPRVGIVQTPQRFYNPDPFQYAFGVHAAWPDDQRAWFEHRLPALDAKQSATCCGTSFLMRMAALLDLGAFPTQSISEDTLTSIQLRARDWHTVYLHEGLSVGLSTEGLAEFLVQRARWSLGTAQIWRYRWDALGAHLLLRKRLRLLESLLRFFLPHLMRFGGYVASTVYWLSGFALVRATGHDLVSYGMPLWSWGLVVAWASRGAILPVVTEAAVLIAAPWHVQASWRGVSGSHNARFAVTSKGVNRRRVTIHWRPLAWLLAVSLPLAASLVHRALDPWGTLAAGQFLLWNLYNSYRLLLVAVVALVPCIERPKHRRAERFRCNEPVRLRLGDSELDCELLDISVHGALVCFPAGTRVGNVVELELWQSMKVRGHVVRSVDERRAAVEFRQLSLEQEERLVAELFCTDRYVPRVFEWSGWKCYVAVLRRVFT